MKNNSLTAKRFLCIEVRMCWIRVAIVRTRKGAVEIEQHAAVTDFDPYQGYERCIALLSGKSKKKTDNKKKKVSLPSTAILITSDAMPGMLNKTAKRREASLRESALSELEDELQLYATPPSLLSFVYYHHHLSMGTRENARQLEEELRFSLNLDNELVQRNIYSEQEMEAISTFLSDFIRLSEPLTITSTISPNVAQGKELCLLSSHHDNEQWRVFLEGQGIDLKALLPRFSSALSLVSEHDSKGILTIVEYLPGLLFFTHIENGSITRQKYAEVVSDELFSLIDLELNTVKSTRVSLVGLIANYDELKERVATLTGDSFYPLHSSPPELWSIMGAATAVSRSGELVHSPVITPLIKPPIPFKKRPSTWWSTAVSLSLLIPGTVMYSNYSELQNIKDELSTLKADNDSLRKATIKKASSGRELAKKKKELEVFKERLATLETKRKKGVILNKKRNTKLTALLTALGNNSSEAVILNTISSDNSSEIVISGVATSTLKTAEFIHLVTQEIETTRFINDTILNTESAPGSSRKFTLTLKTGGR